MIKKLALAGLVLACHAAMAQDLAITNARIVDGTGQVIESGTLVIDGDRIVSVTDGNAATGAAREIDADGMTVMPGLINTHWHLLALPVASSSEAIQQHIDNVVVDLLDSLLARGVTTIMSPGDHLADIIDVRERLADGEVRGPRLLAVGPVFTSPNDWPTQICQGDTACMETLTAQVTTPAEARAKVREVAEAGADAIKLVYDDIIAPDTRIADDVVAAIADEANSHGLTLYAHVSTTEETALSVVELGARALVHPVPFRTEASANGTEILRRLEIPVCTTVGQTPAMAEFAGQPWTDANEENHRRRLDTLKHLHDGGVTLAYGTDSVANARPDLNAFSAARFYGEAEALAEIMSNADVLATLTRNAAVYLGLGDELGTLEAGKIADIVVIDGDPLADLNDLRNVELVIQAGGVVVDNR